MKLNTCKGKSRLLIVTSFYPDVEGTRRGPWGERFSGLYGAIFQNHVSCEVCWYSLAEHSLFQKSPGDGTLRRNMGVFSFLLRELIRLFRVENKSLLFSIIPCLELTIL